MLDCLSCPAWINPQTDFLLFLQNIRIGQPDIIDKFFLSITVFGEFWLPTLICAITYWCIDYRAGIYLFSLESFNAFLAHFFKMLACVYRPWVLDSRIHPSELAVPFAKGYSFPSGHSAMSSSVLGGTAFLLRKKIFVCLLLIALVLLVGFSRLWLGVHTPQDVVCGFIIGLFLIFCTNSIINWAEKEKNRYLYLAGIVDVLVILAVIYIYCFNTYRIDYISGELLVNPDKLKYVTVVVYGYSLGIINGAFLCRRFCPFDPKTVSVKRRILIGVIGTVFVLLLLKCILQQIIMNIIDIRIGTSLMFITGFSVTFIYPLIFTKLNKITHT